MMKLKCLVLSIQFLLFVVKINSEDIYFRGKYFRDGIKKDGLLKEPEIRADERWHIQTLDHFNSGDWRIWPQRFYVNELYYTYSEDSPIFLLVGGEETISPYWMTGGLWVDLARQHGALLLQLEHRFYGLSRPTPDVTVESLQYLTAEQALEDTISFIETIKETYQLKDTNKWIIFGGSYPGNLVAWLRLKYPHLIHGAISSSAPVKSIVDFQDFFQVVVDALEEYSPPCVTTITDAFSTIDQLSLTQIGKETLTNKLNLCDPLEYSEDFETDFSQLNSYLANKISAVVQYHQVDHGSNVTIDNICDILANKELGSSALDRFAALIKILQNKKCFAYKYSNFVNAYAKATSWTDGPNSNNIRQWFYQTCNQMGYFQTSSKAPHVFGNKFPVELSIKQCTDVFGSRYNKGFVEKQSKKTNNRYGGQDIVNNVDNVVFVHGSIDPWYPAGVTSSSNSKSPALFIKGVGHCADALSDDARDLPQLIAARKVISDHVRNWLL